MAQGKTTINIQPIENGEINTLKYYRQARQRPRKPYYESDNAHRITMLRERILSREDIHFARRNKMPLFELQLNDTTIELSRHRGDMLKRLEDKVGGVLYESLPLGVKIPIALNKRGEIHFLK